MQTFRKALVGATASNKGGSEGFGYVLVDDGLSATREEPALTTRQLQQIALDPAWQRASR
ncbi:hypothetical protein OHA88_06915 [Streptomyces sp. NBC_00353]|uniref:hypothetical protein n=1 Tax=Streptomyces sp. NBC_00353 TaxID=2975722 RepID=UPI002E259D33